MNITHDRQFRTELARAARWLFLACLVAALAGCSGGAQPQWRLTNIENHLPDLKFQLTDGHGRAVEGSDYRGKVAILYFGYTHCPDVCPLTLTHLHMVMQKLGPLADQVRILFVSVDPARDTPQILRQYVNAFDKRAIGLTGTEKQLEALAKRYRVAFTRGADTGNGNYEVNHSSAIYIFDAEGRARLLATPVDSNADLVHDLHLLISTESAS